MPANGRLQCFLITKPIQTDIFISFYAKLGGFLRGKKIQVCCSKAAKNIITDNLHSIMLISEAFSQRPVHLSEVSFSSLIFFLALGITPWLIAALKSKTVTKHTKLFTWLNCQQVSLNIFTSYGMFRFKVTFYLTNKFLPAESCIEVFEVGKPETQFEYDRKLNIWGMARGKPTTKPKTQSSSPKLEKLSHVVSFWMDQNPDWSWKHGSCYIF